ncbi:MAG TPA: universal stress protein, partial [Longimicrobiales bacterium]|nr:universal stress protein [Longimicrobiales bacterium]
EEALPMGGSIARRAAARLHLVHVCPALPGEPTSENGAERARVYLGEVTAGVCEELGKSCAFTVLEPSPQRGIGLAPPSSGLSEALHDYVLANGIDLVVMTTHGRSGLSRAWLGSVADAFVRHTSVPVLLLRPGRGPRAARAEARSFETVLVPVDGSAASEEILPPALALAAEGARIILLRVVSPAFDMGSPYLMSSVHVDAESTRERRVEAEEALARSAERLRARGVSVTTTTAVDPVPADAILGFAEENAVDCIAMATRGLGGWSRMVLGSTADKVVRAATLPVLVLRPELTRTAGAAAPALATRAV